MEPVKIFTTFSTFCPGIMNLKWMMKLIKTKIVLHYQMIITVSLPVKVLCSVEGQVIKLAVIILPNMLWNSRRCWWIQTWCLASIQHTQRAHITNKLPPLASTTCAGLEAVPWIQLYQGASERWSSPGGALLWEPVPRLQNVSRYDALPYLAHSSRHHDRHSGAIWQCTGEL